MARKKAKAKVRKTRPGKSRKVLETRLAPGGISLNQHELFLHL